MRTQTRRHTDRASNSPLNLFKVQGTLEGHTSRNLSGKPCHAARAGLSYANHVTKEKAKNVGKNKNRVYRPRNKN